MHYGTSYFVDGSVASACQDGVKLAVDGLAGNVGGIASAGRLAHLQGDAGGSEAVGDFLGQAVLFAVARNGVYDEYDLYLFLHKCPIRMQRYAITFIYMQNQTKYE